MFSHDLDLYFHVEDICKEATSSSLLAPVCVFWSDSGSAESPSWASAAFGASGCAAGAGFAPVACTIADSKALLSFSFSSPAVLGASVSYSRDIILSHPLPNQKHYISQNLLRNIRVS